MRLLTELEATVARAIVGVGPDRRRALESFFESIDFENAGPSIWRLAPIIHRRAGEEAVVHPLVRRFGGLARNIWLGNEVRIRALPQVLDILEPISPVVLLKGAATWAYFGSRAEFRPLGDIDLLVRPDRIVDVTNALRANGWMDTFLAVDRMEPDDFLKSPGAPFVRSKIEEFDVHWSPVHDFSDTSFADAVIDDARVVPFAGRSVSVPDITDHLMILLLHAAGARPGNRRIDWVCEAALILEQDRYVIDWSRFDEITERYGVTERLRSTVDDLSDLGVRVAWRPRGALRPLQRLEDRLRRRDTDSRTRLEAGFCAFQEARRDCGWRLVPVMRNGTLPTALARASRAAVAARPSKSLKSRATSARRWALRWHRRFDTPFVVGWSWPEVTGGRWSDGPVAALSLPTRLPPGSTARLAVVFSPFVLEGGGLFRMTMAAGRDVVSVEYQEPHDRAIARLDAEVTKDGFVVVGFGLLLSGDRASATDHRRHGMYFHEALVAGVQVRTVPCAIDLAGAGPQPPELVEGWGLPEEAGTWTVGRTSRLVMHLAPTSGDIRISFHTVTALVDEGGSVRFVARVNGERRVRFAAGREPRVVRIDIRRDEIRLDGTVEIALKARDPTSPAALGLSADRRTLGVMLRRIEITPLPERAVLATGAPEKETR